MPDLAPTETLDYVGDAHEPEEQHSRGRNTKDHADKCPNHRPRHAPMKSKLVSEKANYDDQEDSKELDAPASSSLFDI